MGKHVLSPTVKRKVCGAASSDAAAPNQLLMFDPAHRSRDPSSSGESAVAALQFVGTPVAHLRLETAYWAKPAKIKALEKQALKK